MDDNQFELIKAARHRLRDAQQLVDVLNSPHAELSGILSDYNFPQPSLEKAKQAVIAILREECEENLRQAEAAWKAL